MPDPVRRWCCATLTILYAAAALAVIAYHAATAGHVGSRPDAAWITAQYDRLHPLRDRLSIERTYRYVTPRFAASSLDAAEYRALAAYSLAPVRIDVDSPSPWVLVDCLDEPALAAWLQQQRDDLATAARRLGGGVALVVEESSP